MSLQQEAYLRDGQHEASKHHGKLRTKYNRLASSVHVLTQVCARFLQQKSHNGFDMEGFLACTRPLVCFAPSIDHRLPA